jgi:uncharacterized membrane protein
LGRRGDKFQGTWDRGVSSSLCFGDKEFKIEEDFPMTCTRRVCLVLIAISLAGVEPALSQSGSQAHRGLREELLPGFRSNQSLTSSRPVDAAHDPVVLGLAKAKVYKFATVDYPGAAFSLAVDANLSTVVGAFNYNPSGSSSTLETAFTLKNGAYQTLSVPGAQASAAEGINTGGQIVGLYVDSSSTLHGFLDTAGSFTNIDFPGGTASLARSINDSGEIVGAYADTNGAAHGFLDDAGVFTSVDYPGATATECTGINFAGDIVGIWKDSSSNFHGFLLSGGVFSSIDFPLGINTTPFGINDSGEIAGYYEDASFVSHGFLYSAGAFTRVDVVGAAQAELLRIKNNGTITGAFTDALGEAHGLKGH